MNRVPITKFNYCLLFEASVKRAPADLFYECCMSVCGRSWCVIKPFVMCAFIINDLSHGAHFKWKLLVMCLCVLHSPSVNKFCVVICCHICILCLRWYLHNSTICIAVYSIKLSVALNLPYVSIVFLIWSECERTLLCKLIILAANGYSWKYSAITLYSVILLLGQVA